MRMRVQIDREREVVREEKTIENVGGNKNNNNKPKANQLGHNCFTNAKRK